MVLDDGNYDDEIDKEEVFNVFDGNSGAITWFGFSQT